MTHRKMLCTATLAGSLILTAAAMSPTAIAGPSPAAEGTGDGPDTYVVFRTLPETAAPSVAQNKACDDHFGSPRSSTVVLRQAAVSMVPRVDGSGLAVDELASYVGPSYICAAPDLTSSDLSEAYADAKLPFGFAAGSGPCTPSLRGVIGLAPFLGCRLAMGPVPSVGSPGGYAISNTVSGSIFMGFVARDPSQPLPYTPPPSKPPHNTLPNDPDFYLWRTADQQNATTFPDCARAGALLPSGAQQAALSPTQPDLTNGVLDPDEAINRVGRVTVCFLGGNAERRTAVALVRFPRAGRTVIANASGDCRTAPLAGRTDLRVQTCRLSVLFTDSTLTRAGQLISIGLVRADNPLVAANSHVWSLGIIDGQTG